MIKNLQSFKIILIASAVMLLLPSILFSQWINEIHYDNNSTDANECIEIAGVAGTDISGYSIVLYNGGTWYDIDFFTGVIPDEGCGYGTATICYPVNGIQNGAADGIVLYDGTSVIQFLSYEGVIVATNGVADGITSTDIGVSEGLGTPVGNSLQVTGSGNTSGAFSWQTDAPASFGSLNIGQTISPCNAITTGAITGAPFTVECSVPTTDAGSVDFTSTGTFNPGNIYTAQLSDASGSFANPVNIGTLSSTANSGTINITIPAGMLTGGGYLIRIISDNPPTTGSTSASFTITQSGSCTPAYITSVIINSCNPTCSEGFNELIFGTTGDNSVLINSANFQISYGSSLPGNTLTDNLNTNPATTANLNTTAGCPGLMVDGTGMTLPPNSSFVLAHDGLCVDALDWSGLCGSGPIYIIYTTDPTWNTAGTFLNSAGGIRYFNTAITNDLGITDNIDYDYNSSDLASHNDGDYITFGPNGGTAQTYGDDNCMLNPVLLPVELILFTGKNEQEGNRLRWKTASETNSDYFTLERTADGKNWEIITTQVSAGNTNSLSSYWFIDNRFEPTVNYYRLSQTDFDGTTKVYNDFVAIDNSSNNSLNLVRIINLLGQEIDRNQPGIQIHIYDDGTSKKLYKD